MQRMTQCLQRELAADAYGKASSVSALFAPMSSALGGGRGSKGFAEALASAQKNLNGIRRSLEYIQDYMQVHGLAVWQEVISCYQTYSLSLSLTHTLLHTHTHLCTLIHTLTHSLSLSHTHTHTYACTLTHSLLPHGLRSSASSWRRRRSGS